MFQRFAKVFVCSACTLLFAGCIETTQIITLNPDGKGKVTYEVLTASPAGMDPAGAAGGKEKSLEEMRKDAAANLLTKTKGVTAWKDVTVKWAPDGRLHILGTAYFDRLDDLSGGGNPGGLGNDSMMLSIINFQVTVDKDSIKIGAKKNDPNPAPKAPAPDVNKMTDRELDEFLLKQRVGYQGAKPLLIMMFTDLKCKTVFKLPGEVKDSKGFKMDQAGMVHMIDGNEILKGYKKFMAQDNATMKKLLKAGNPNIMESFGMSEEMMEPSLTVGKLGKAQFEYAKEVEAAREAYPQLRQLFGVAADLKLPGEK